MIEWHIICAPKKNVNRKAVRAQVVCANFQCALVSECFSGSAANRDAEVNHARDAELKHARRLTNACGAAQGADGGTELKHE